MRTGLVLLAIVAVSGCASPAATGDGSAGDGPATSDDFPVVSCTVAYRSTVTEPLERTEEVTLHPGEEHELVFDEVTVGLTYLFDQGEGGTLLLDAAAPDGDGFRVRDLYQFVAGEPPARSFAGGHGFTGLGYVYPPDSEAEAQYHCGVEEGS